MFIDSLHTINCHVHLSSLYTISGVKLYSNQEQVKSKSSDKLRMKLKRNEKDINNRKELLYKLHY